VIINTDGDKKTTRYVWISAVDGTIIKTEEELPRKMSAISGGVLNGRPSHFHRPVILRLRARPRPRVM
jgi:hypothetical protein